MEKAIEWIDTLSTWLGIPISWLYVVLMFIITYDVTLRYFFSAPTEWAFDYAIMMYGTCSCCAAPIPWRRITMCGAIWSIVSVRYASRRP